MIRKTKISTENLSVSYQNKNVLKNIRAEIEKGKITVLLGTNGSGKSTLLKAISGILPFKEGSIYLDGKEMSSQSKRSIAKQLAMLPQISEASLDMTVYELVEQGRFPHVGPLKMMQKQDHKAIISALEDTNLLQYQDHSLDELSGGERQRAWLALSLAQQTETLLLDEPTTFMDIHHQISFLNLVNKLNKEENKTIVMVLHDINQALAYADQIIVLKDRRIYSSGVPSDVITPDLLLNVFHIKASLVNDPQTSKTVIIPYEVV